MISQTDRKALFNACKTPADPATREYRKSLKELGIAVAFHDGLSRKDALNILRNLNILRSQLPTIRL